MELNRTTKANLHAQWVVLALAGLIGVTSVFRVSVNSRLPRLESAIVSAHDVSSRITYSQQMSCYSGLTACDAYFPAIPAKKKLVIEKATITVETNTRLKYISFYGDRIENVPVQSRGRNGARNHVYATDRAIQTCVRAGDQPNFKVVVSKGFSAFSNSQIELSGYLVDADPAPGGSLM